MVVLTPKSDIAKKTNKPEFRAEKLIKKKGIKEERYQLFGKWKGHDNS